MSPLSPLARKLLLGLLIALAAIGFFLIVVTMVFFLVIVRVSS